MAAKTKKKQWNTEDGDALLHYNVLDTCGTARVDRGIREDPEWNTPRVQRLYQVHEDLSKLGSEMHMTGFYIHQENRKKLIKQLRNLSTRRHNELVKHVGREHSPAFRGTDNDMRALLYRRCAVEGIRCYDTPEPEEWDEIMWTETGNLAVGKEALLRIFINPSTPPEVRECISLFWRAKAPNKALSTWVTGKEIMERFCDDGRCRPNWNSAGTETMRFSGELMTLPEEKDDETLGGKLPNIRAQYCARPGWNLLHWDWSQQELRIWAEVYDDDNLREALKTGDVYSYDARQWFPKQLQEAFGAEWQTVNLKKNWKNGRRQVKVIHLGCQYLAGPAAVWTQGLIQDQSLKFHTVKMLHTNGFHVTYRTGVQNIQKNHEHVNKVGYSEGHILGGRRYYPAPPPITETANYDVQRTAGEMGALAKLAIWKTIKKEKLPACILTDEHDASTIEYQMRDSIERELVDIVRTCVTGPWTIKGRSLVMPFGYHTGYDWAEACAD